MSSISFRVMTPMADRFDVANIGRYRCEDALAAFGPRSNLEWLVPPSLIGASTALND